MLLDAVNADDDVACWRLANRAQRVAYRDLSPEDHDARVEPAVEQTQVVEQKVEQPAVVEVCQPVIIDRFEKRHRSLLHLNLFPFALFR